MRALPLRVVGEGKEWGVESLGGGEKVIRKLSKRKANSCCCDRLGIELAKTMSLNYSNQETSVTVGESVRDEDGIFLLLLPPKPERASC